jgi:hypothetical protein
MKIQNSTAVRRIARLLVLTGALAACDSDENRTPHSAEAQTGGDFSAQLTALAGAAESDGAAWYALAVDAREAGDGATAARALDEAEAAEYSPVRIGLERARLAVLDRDAAAAVQELQALADGGFTAVAAITGDPLLSSLAGEPGFDALVATLSEAAYPCEHDDKFRDFDFWVGEWDVHDGSGQLAGHNVIESSQHGCVLVENWTSATGGTGMSMNWLDHDRDEWVQIWIDSSGGQIDIRGGLTDEGMRLTGKIHYTGNNTTAPFRGLWTLMPDGRVRQFFEQSNDGGETWQPWFEGFYSRAGQSEGTAAR